MTLVLGGYTFERRDGTRVGRLLVASPASPPRRGYVVAEVEALPDVLDTMADFPGLYDLQTDIRVLPGYGREAPRSLPVVVSARLLDTVEVG